MDAEAWEGVDRDLFDVLRIMRSSIAKADGVPPYIVFHDAALREIARAVPTQLEDASEIKGIGEKIRTLRLHRYSSHRRLSAGQGKRYR